MDKRKKPPLPPGWDPATTPIMRFVSCVIIIDIDGIPYELTAEGKTVKIIEQFSKKVVYDGPAPKGTYGMDYAMFIAQAIGKW